MNFTILNRMAFDALMYVPQWQGGPNPEGVRLGSSFLYETLSEQLPIHVIDTNESADDTQHDIRHYMPILTNLNQCREWLHRKRPRSLFTLGGDCSIDVAGIDWLNSQYGKSFGVVWIDAHSDIHTPQASETKYFHGMPLRTLLGEGDPAILKLLHAPLEHHQICYAGIRSIDPPEAQYIVTHKLPVISAAAINEGDYSTFLRWRETSSIRHLHIHFDLDALDPEDNICVTYRVDNGIRLDAMEQFLCFLHNQGMTVGFTLTEYAATEKNPEEIEKILSLISSVVPVVEVLAA